MALGIVLTALLMTVALGCSAVDALQCEEYQDVRCKNAPPPFRPSLCQPVPVNCTVDQPFCYAAFAVLPLNGMMRMVKEIQGCWSQQDPDDGRCKSGGSSYCTNDRPPRPNPVKPARGPLYFCCCDGQLCNQNLLVNKEHGAVEFEGPALTMTGYWRLKDAPPSSTGVHNATIPTNRPAASPLTTPPASTTVEGARTRFTGRRLCLGLGRRPFRCIARSKMLLKARARNGPALSNCTRRRSATAPPRPVPRGKPSKRPLFFGFF